MTAFSELSAGDRVRVLGFKKGNVEYRQKLLAMGLTPQTEFSFVRRAPLGDPVELKVKGCSFSLRLKEATLLNIQRL